VCPFPWIFRMASLTIPGRRAGSPSDTPWHATRPTSQTSPACTP
jgi:hypothetical protein